MNLTTVLLLVVTAMPTLWSYEANRKCEKNRALLCNDLYNSTRFPNFFKQRSQNDAIEELGQYKQLIQIECARHLRLFLCSVLMPMCTMLEENILPCRSLCERVVELCWFIMAGTPEMQSVPGEWEGESLCGKQECRTEQEKME